MSQQAKVEAPSNVRPSDLLTGRSDDQERGLPADYLESYLVSGSRRSDDRRANRTPDKNLDKSRGRSNSSHISDNQRSNNEGHGSHRSRFLEDVEYQLFPVNAPKLDADLVGVQTLGKAWALEQENKSSPNQTTQNAFNRARWPAGDDRPGAQRSLTSSKKLDRGANGDRSPALRYQEHVFEREVFG